MPKVGTTSITHRRERARINREKRERGERVIAADGSDRTAGKVNRGGHPTELLTRKLIQAIARITERGSFPHHAAVALGVNESTFRKWMTQGGKGQGDPLYAELYTIVNAARAKAITAAEARIVLAGEKGIWQADARMLESMASSDWMRTEKRVNEGGEAFSGVLEELKELREKEAAARQSPVSPDEKKPIASRLTPHEQALIEAQVARSVPKDLN